MLFERLPLQQYLYGSQCLNVWGAGQGDGRIGKEEAIVRDAANVVGGLLHIFRVLQQPLILFLCTGLCVLLLMLLLLLQ